MIVITSEVRLTDNLGNQIRRIKIHVEVLCEREKSEDCFNFTHHRIHAISVFHCYFYFIGIIGIFNWQNSSCDTSSVSNGYRFLRKDRQRRRGEGLALHVKKPGMFLTGNKRRRISL